jgi:N-acetyl-anhydromuramyl-L-alanine amidase AmpD
VIHHTDSPNPPGNSSGTTLEKAKAYARAIQKDHIESDRTKFQDSGHNFLNTVNGTILEGRHGSLDAVIKGRCVRSAHAKRADGNSSPGIENEGNFMTHKMDATQWNSLVELCAALCKSCNIDPDNIKGHRDFFRATDCPGDWLYGQLGRLQTDVRASLS